MIDLDKGIINESYGNGKVINFKELVKNKIKMKAVKEVKEEMPISDHSIPVKVIDINNYSFKNEQERFYADFKTELCNRLQPVVENLTEYLRALEGTEAGRGKAEIETMLKAGDINTAMYDILMPALDSLVTPYVVDLKSSKYFEPNTKQA